MKGLTVALRFVEAINAHDTAALIGLMTPNHNFVDSLGDSASRPAIERGWKQYFRMVPDYWIRIEKTFSEEDSCVLIGTAGGTYVPRGGAVRAENSWETPAVWTARIEGRKIAEWRIYCDNEPIRAKMRELRH